MTAEAGASWLEAAWTWDFFTQAAEKCHKAGFPFGIPLSTTSDAVQMVGAVCNSYGVQFMPTGTRLAEAELDGLIRHAGYG